MAKVKPIPEGRHTVTPHLTVKGCAQAIEFYKKAFGAREISRHAGPDGGIMHAEIKIGDSGWAKLVTGERAEGTVRFVAKSADAATRTFRLELEVPNKDGALRDGVTADIHVTSDKVEAHKISPAILALDDRGIAQPLNGADRSLAIVS